MSELKEEPLYFEFLHQRKDFLDKNTFFDPTDFPWSRIIKDNYQLIKEEVIAFYGKNKKDFNPYFADSLMNLPGKWRSYGFYFWGLRAGDHICKEFANTLHILKRVPGIVSASVSIMEPGSEIKPHYGDTNAIYRCHFGLVIPAGLPETGFQVGYEQREWKEGEFLIFNDTAYHKAWNKSEQQRVILILDVIRPEFMDEKLWICARVYAIINSQKFVKKHPQMEWLIKLKVIQWLLSTVNVLDMSIIKHKKLWLESFKMKDL